MNLSFGQIRTSQNLRGNTGGEECWGVGGGEGSCGKRYEGCGGSWGGVRKCVGVWGEVRKDICGEWRSVGECMG